MRAADLLTILTKSPKKTEYQGVFLAQEQKTGACDNGPDK